MAPITSTPHIEPTSVFTAAAASFYYWNQYHIYVIIRYGGLYRLRTAGGMGLYGMY